MPYPELVALQSLRAGLVLGKASLIPPPFKDALLMELYPKVCCAHLQQFNSQSLIGFKSLIVHSLIDFANTAVSLHRLDTPQLLNGFQSQQFDSWTFCCSTCPNPMSLI